MSGFTLGHQAAAPRHFLMVRIAAHDRPTLAPSRPAPSAPSTPAALLPARSRSSPGSPRASGGSGNRPTGSGRSPRRRLAARAPGASPKSRAAREMIASRDRRRPPRYLSPRGERRRARGLLGAAYVIVRTSARPGTRPGRSHRQRSCPRRVARTSSGVRSSRCQVSRRTGRCPRPAPHLRGHTFRTRIEPRDERTPPPGPSSVQARMAPRGRRLRTTFTSAGSGLRAPG